MSPAAAVSSDDETRRLAREAARVFDECRASLAVHPRKLRELAAVRASASGGRFLPAFCNAITPLFEVPRRSPASDRVTRFAVAFASSSASAGADGTGFLEGFLRFLLVASAAALRPARFRACQIISEIIMQVPDDAEVSSEIWDEVIDGMKIRVQDKIPAIRVFAVRALSRFAIDEEDGGIIGIFLETLEKEQNAEVRKTIILSLPPSSATLESIIESTIDTSESVRRAAYFVLSTKFPLQSLSIKQRTTLLHRGISDRSPSVNNECLRMLKEEWLVKHCGGDVIALLRFLDVETYESVGESVMGVLLKDGAVRVQDGQTIMQYFTENTEDAEQVSSIKLMEAEVALYWKVMCMHLQAEAQIKGSEAATTTGTEAAVYASEASDKNDLLDGVLPSTVAEFVDLVKAHLSAGPNYHFASRQLLLLGGMLDFSDSMNRKVASSFLYELLNRPLEHEVDEDGNQIAIGDGVSLGGDLQWAKAVSELAKKVHASVGEFEMVIATVVEELARPCRERTADFMQWMHCLAVTGLLLENTSTLRSLEGTAIRPSEVLQSLLLPAAKQKHVDVQRAALRCLCLFGLLENKPSTELVKQLRLSFINGPDLVSAMASKALIDLVTWHGPQELDQAIGTEPSDANYEKTQFAPVDISDLNDDDLNVGILSILFSGFHKDDWGFSPEGDNHDNVLTILGEGFAKILLLSENYPSISADLHPVILAQLVRLYFLEESKELGRLKQCLSVFFLHYPSLSDKHKRCVSSAFVPLMRAMWPGIHGNPGGSGPVVSKRRKHAVQAARFMVQMVQSPLFSAETAEQACMSPESLSGSPGLFVNYDISEEGLAIRIAVEVGNSQDKKSAPVRAYALALCKVAVLLRFRQSEQKAIKCMRGLVNTLAASAASDKDLMKELAQMASRLKSLDESPEEELPQDQADALFEQLGLADGIKLDTVNPVVPPTPAPSRSGRAPPARRRARRAASSSDDSEAEAEAESLDVTSGSQVQATPSVTTARAQRASKTAALSKFKSSVKPSLEAASDSEQEEMSGLTTDEDPSDDSDDPDEESS
ncbi:condensin complex subunit 3 [Hordeum vulgare]|uniref:Nuclear condensin complex subunit 3 C-terminal domain-containing protein n=1 Tax=Hordeum vulgare subsp. vulgare TaxID=112509 RepID=A0A8I6Z8X3_HORVV|nr:condensin complex subunit 3 [Hordeum vulgare subsp. vulgare]KAE8784728.1 condensin complex subunit 3 [Hordeum vulgare]